MSNTHFGQRKVQRENFLTWRKLTQMSLQSLECLGRVVELWSGLMRLKDVILASGRSRVGSGKTEVNSVLRTFSCLP